MVDLLKPLAPLRTLAQQTRRTKGSQSVVLSPEEEESITKRLARLGLSGLQWVGGVLDKPGAAVRGTISAAAGGPAGGGLMNLLPVAWGGTPLEERVTGRDLLTTLGIAPPRPTSWMTSRGWRPGSSASLLAKSGGPRPE
jgi:hypothetical protein